jgi:hypothetical protein
MKAINKYCPRSGKPVRFDSLTRYRGVAVGFCNPGCRDDFSSNISDRPEDRRYFDALINELDLHDYSKLFELYVKPYGYL